MATKKKSAKKAVKKAAPKKKTAKASKKTVTQIKPGDAQGVRERPVSETVGQEAATIPDPSTDKAGLVNRDTAPMVDPEKTGI
jgi:hypothetical protein